jgi:uncharacterized protein YecE (DUF72 family)
MQSVRIGTCGWSYRDWQGVFYPATMLPGHFLSYYADHCPVVEVDSSFYRAPTPAMVESWRGKTPDGFGFSLKVPGIVTHEKILVDCGKEVDEFLAAARLLGNKLLCCLLQFPYFNAQKIASLDAFLARRNPFLGVWPKEVPVAVEIRNRQWLTPKLVKCLRGHNAVWALADKVRLPSPGYLVSKTDVITGPFAYVRLIGDRNECDRRTQKLDHIAIDRSAEIKADAEAIHKLSARVPVLAFVNNHFAGYAPETIRQLCQALRYQAFSPPTCP